MDFNIEQQFRKETNGGWVRVDDYPHEEYTDEYVEWLESKIKQSSEQNSNVSVRETRQINLLINSVRKDIALRLEEIMKEVNDVSQAGNYYEEMLGYLIHDLRKPIRKAK